MARRVNRPGLVLLPLHHFGIVGAGLPHALSAKRVSVLRPQWNLALTPQTNSMDETVRWLEAARTALGVRKGVPEESLYHYRRTRARWLDHNPLLAVRVVNIAGRPYENQRLLMSRVRAATGLLAMVSVLQPAVDNDSARLFSTSKTNNFETLDINHYVVMSDHPAISRYLESHIVPLNLDREDVYELTDLSVELNPQARARKLAAFERAEAAVRHVYAGYLRYSYGTDGNRVSGRVYRKAFESLNFFRRSFRSSGGQWSATVSLAIAFEILLTDSYGRGITDQIVRRVSLVLRGVPYKNDRTRAVRELFAARGEVVHRGRDEAFDLRPAQKAYVAVFSRLAPALATVKPQSNAPLRDVTGDTIVEDPATASSVPAKRI